MTPLKVLHIIGQRPEMTGSGIYLSALIRESRKLGLICFRIAGVPVDNQRPTERRELIDGYNVCFESAPLDFPVVGMSDVMPYPSLRFRDLKGRHLTAYKAVFTRALQDAVHRFNPDIIHTNHLFLLSAQVRKTCPQIPMVTTCHGTELRQVELCPHLRPFVKRHCRDIDRIIALSSDQKADIQRCYDIPADNIAVIGGGYDDTLFTRANKDTAGPVQILYAGKLNRSKGVPWLLRALINIRHQDWHLHLAGSGNGPEFDECMALANRLGAKVSNHGYVSHRRLAALMQQAHIQVLPSFFEGLPLVLFEGLACGCRIITTRLPGFAEMFGKAREDTVRLIPLPPLETVDRPYAKDEEALIDALAQSLVEMIAAVKQSPQINDPQADRIAIDYTWSRVVGRTLSVYAEMVAKKAT